jgi:stearoyl-CoA desaturase (delta-9 desaturase)
MSKEAVYAEPHRRRRSGSVAFLPAQLLRRISWRYASVVIGYHLLSALAFIPWLFSWTGVALCAGGVVVFGVLGVTVCYHRLLTHRSFKCPKWLEHTLAVVGLLNMQDAPARWVAVHRRHHEYADEELDPHTPVKSFFWSHVGWLLVDHPDLTRFGIYERYAKDILRDRFYVQLERHIGWIMLASWVAFYFAGFLAKLTLGGSIVDAVQFGSSVLVWGVFVRTVVTWHISWSVNSVTHRFGYRNYETDEGSRNSILVSILSGGEGWHNNHHADPRSANFGHRRWEVDIGYLFIRFLEKLGLASDIIEPHGRYTPARDPSGRLLTHVREDIGI